MSITALGSSYVAGIESHTTVRAVGTGPRPPKKWFGSRATTEARCAARRQDKPASVRKLAFGFAQSVARRIDHMAGSHGEKLSSRSARVRVRVAHRDYWLADSSAGGAAVD